MLGTSSSESALPSLMEKLERLGCSKSVVGLVVPTGYSFNLDGTNIYMTLATLFIAQALDFDLTLGQQITILLVAMLTSKGASGITGAGFITLAATLAVVDPRLVPGMAIVLGIDKFMSECRALTNLCGNGVACVVVSWWEGELDRERLAGQSQQSRSIRPTWRRRSRRGSRFPNRRKPPGFAGRFFVSEIWQAYSPLPKRRDHHPARRGWVSVVVSAAGCCGWCRGWRRLWRLAVADRRCRVRLGIDQEAHLLAHRRAPPRGGPFGLLSGLGFRRRPRRFLRTAIGSWLLGRRRNGFGLR